MKIQWTRVTLTFDFLIENNGMILEYFSQIVKSYELPLWIYMDLKRTDRQTDMPKTVPLRNTARYKVELIV